MLALQAAHTMLRATGRVEAGNNEDAGDLFSIVEHVGESLQELPPEAPRYWRAGARVQPNAACGSIDSVYELFAETGTLTFVPIPSQCDVDDRHGGKPDVCH